MTDDPTTKLGTEPRYSVSHAADLIRANRNTVRAWFTGIQFAKRAPQRAVLKLDHPECEPTMLSFFNLVEAGFLAAYRAKKISMQRLRAAMEFAESRLGIERPLLTDSFRTDGQELFLEHDRSLLEATKSPGQYVWPEAVSQYFQSVDYRVGGPTAYWLLGRERGCVADPRLEFGEPIVPRRAIRVELIYSRFRGRESVDEIAEDLKLLTEEVEEAIRCGDDLNLAA
jgi:uncharacterized protein (DUF433 family)